MNWDTIGDGFKVSTSAGVNQLRPDEAPDDVLTRADVALYRAKNAARNRVSKDYWSIWRFRLRLFRSGGVEITAPAPPSLTPGRTRNLN